VALPISSPFWLFEHDEVTNVLATSSRAGDVAARNSGACLAQQR
jgi:hypothetical protein